MKFELNNHGGWIVPPDTMIPAHSVVPEYSEIGQNCTIGYGCQIGDSCRIGYGCQIGNSCQIGGGSTIEGVVLERWLTLANVDGSGRQSKKTKDWKRPSAKRLRKTRI